MSASLSLLLAVAALYACGVYLLLERSLTRVLLGIVLLGNATNLLLLSAGGPAGEPAFAGVDESEVSDPLVQAMILTSIVITLGVVAFVLALLHRGWVLARDDVVLDDEADRLVRESTAEEEDLLGPGEPEYDSGDDRPERPDR